MSFTVVDRIRALGYEPVARLSWECGDAVREAYYELEGHLPEKALRPKTNALGSHCFAVYPEGFMVTADRLIQRIAGLRQAMDKNQLDLFK